MRQRRAGRQQIQALVRLAAVALTPRHFPGVAVQIPPADMVMLANLGPTKAREIRLGLIGASTLVAESYQAVDVLGVKPPYSSFNA